MRRLSDLSLPDPDDVAQVLRNAVSGGSTVVDPSVGATAAVAGLSGTPLAGLIVLISRGYVQEKGVELTAKTDQKLDDIVDSLDETERRQRCLAGVLQGLQTLLPEGEQYQDPSLRTAEGDPENLAALFQTYQDDPERRHDMEAAVERVLSGDLDQDALDAEHDDFVDYLQDAFRVDTRDQAVAMFLDFRDLLQAREVHDAVASIEELEFDQEALSAKLADTERRLADRLPRRHQYDNRGDRGANR